MTGILRRLTALAICGAWAAPRLAGADAPEISIRWVDDSAHPAVEVVGISSPALAALEREALPPDKWAALFSVFAEDAETSTGVIPPMAGTWRIQNQRLRFEPKFPFVKKVRYHAEFRPAWLPGGALTAPVVSSALQLPDVSAAPTTTVAQIYPTADVLPENQLKFYVQFSAPMSRGAIYDHIHLRDADGREADLPFLDINEELWDPAMTRITLLVDPGRIKRGVKPLEDLGPVFEAGKSYSLTIDAAWRDAEGRPLRAAFRKDFRVGPADRTPPDPKRWTVRPPPAGTREPLTIVFDEPMDRALALRLMTVATAAGRPVEGEPALAEQEKRWSFVPKQPWVPGDYKMVVATTIEDLAGNNIGKVFDVDVFDNVQHTLTTTSVDVPFTVK